MAAAAWVHAHRRHARRRLREAHDGIDTNQTRQELDPCPQCGRAVGLPCNVCGGKGKIVRTITPEGPAALEPEVAAAVGEFLGAYAAIKRFGVEGWLASTGGGGGCRPDIDLLDRVMMLDVELERLEFEDDVAEALERAKERE